MSGQYAAILGKLNYSVSNRSEFINANKKLSESRIGMCAIKALSTELEIEISVEEFKTGRRCRFEITDHYCCTDCSNFKPINRWQCPTCKGLGYIQLKRTEDVLLPAGLISGQRIIYKGLGRHDFRSGNAGDLIIRIKTVHDHFDETTGA